MANSPPDGRCVFVETNLETNLVALVQEDEGLSDFKEKFCKEHKECFPEVGEISITALKVKRRGFFFHMPDSMILSTLFKSTTESWVIYADLVRVDKGGLTIMAADQNCELLEKKKENTIDTNDLTSGEALGTQVDKKKKSRKRKTRSSDAKESRKKPAIDLNQSRETEEIESCEEIGIGMGENQQSSGAGQEKTITINSELVNGHTIDEVKDLQRNQTPEEALGTEITMGKSNESRESCGRVPSEKLGDLTGAIEQDVEKGEKTAELVKNDQDKDVAPTLELVNGHTTEAGLAVILPKEKQDEFLSGAIERDNGRGDPSAADNLQTAELVTFTDNQLEGSSGLTTGQATEKRRKRKKRSTDHISQSTAAVTSTSRDLVNEINGVPGVDATSESGLVETLVNPLAEAIQKENDELGGIETDTANHLEANSPAIERKKRRKKSSKDHINQLTAAPKDTGNEISAKVDCVAATSESCPISGRGNLGDPLAAVQKENEMGDEVVGSGKAIASASDIIIQTDNSAKENQLVGSSGLTTGPATEKKRKRKKSSKDHIKQSSTTTSSEIVNEKDKVSGTIACVDAISDSRGEKLADETLVEATQNENDNSAENKNVESKDATQESKTLDHVGEDEVEIEAKSVKKSSNKKKRSRKEASLVGPGAENVEPIKEVVDGEGSDKVIRDVLESLQEKEEILEKSVKKSSKRLKKRRLNVENKPKDTDAKETSVEEDEKEKAADMGDTLEEDGKKQDEVSGGAKSKKPKERKSRANAANSNSVAVKKTSKLNFFKDGDKSDSSEDEASYVDDDSPALECVPDSQAN